MEVSALRELIICSPDGAFQARLTPLSSQQVAAALRETGQSGYKTLPPLAELHGQPVQLALAEKKALAAVEVKSLNIKCYSQSTAEGLIVPTFSPLNGGAVERTLTWRVPDDMQLKLAVNGRFSEGIWQYVEGFFYAKHRSGTPGGYFKLPLPNLFPDGRICLGRSFAPTARSLLGLLQICFGQLQETIWGGDLMPLVSCSQQLFRWQGTNQQPPTAAWPSLCTRVNRTEMEVLNG